MNDDKEQIYYEVIFPYSKKRELDLIVWCITYCNDDWDYRFAYSPTIKSHDQVIVMMFKSRNDALYIKCCW